MDNAIHKRTTPSNNRPHPTRHRKTICAKYQNAYGEPCPNKVVVFQVSAISAIMFVIYQYGVMQDYESLNHKGKLPTRMQPQRGPGAATDALLPQIEIHQNQQSPDNITKYIAKLKQQYGRESIKRKLHERAPHDYANV